MNAASDRVCGVDDCDRPIPASDNSTVCPRCWADTVQTLTQMPTLLNELDTTISRQSATQPTNDRRSTEIPLPFNETAADALNLITVTLKPWALETPHPPTQPTTIAYAIALITNQTWLHNHPHAHRFVEEFTHTTTRAWSAVDQRPEPTYKGPCNAPFTDGTRCTADLYTRRGATHARCNECEAIHNISDRDKQAIEASKDTLWALDDALPILRNVGVIVRKDDVTRHRRRGRIKPALTCADGLELWRIDDLIAVAS